MSIVSLPVEGLWGRVAFSILLTKVFLWCKQCLIHNKCSQEICWVNEWLNEAHPVLNMVKCRHWWLMVIRFVGNTMNMIGFFFHSFVSSSKKRLLPLWNFFTTFWIHKFLLCLSINYLSPIAIRKKMIKKQSEFIYT